MLGNSLNELSKFYSGNSLNHKSLRVSHLESGELASNRICHSGSNSVHHKNINDKKIDMPNVKKPSDDIHTKVPNGANFLNSSHQSKKFLDTLNDKNMCHYIFQQHLNLKSQALYEKVDPKAKDKNTIKASTSDLKPRDNFYRTHSPYHLFGKNSNETQMKMPPPLHANMPHIPSPPGSFGAKQLSKLKRFLTTLQQFAVDISPETGERVRGLVLNLVNSVISIEEFHTKLQEATNFPLRPFVIPFLRANLPLLQYELLNFTRLSKMNTSDFLNQTVENFLFNENPPQNNPSPTHYPAAESMNNKLKRKTPDNETLVPQPNKKLNNQSMPLLYISSSNSHLSGQVQNHGLPAPPPIRPRPSPPHQQIPQIPIQPHLGVHYPVPNIPKQPFVNHMPNFINSHIPNSSSPKNFYPVPNSIYQNRESPFHHSNGPASSPFNAHSSHFGQLHINPTININNQSGLVIPNQMNGKNVPKQDDHFLRGKDKNFTNYMKEFEQDFNEALSVDTVDIDFKNIDCMLNSIFDMVEKTQKVLDTVHSKAQKLKKQKEFYESELKRMAEPNNEQICANEVQKKSNDVINSKNDQRRTDQLGQEKEKSEGLLKESNQDENAFEKCWNCGRRGIETCSKCSQAKFCSHFCKNKHFEVKHYIQLDLENVKTEKSDEKENEVTNGILPTDSAVEKQENNINNTKSNDEEESKNGDKNCKIQNENRDTKE